ncbi:CsbD family protein [Undibacterium sp. SXout7W]|uniref:CsbD family protein n=1 Tax=Undibacterium sp. SXout7W TaxID=3413049 RepID=UPI003BF19F5F
MNKDQVGGIAKDIAGKVQESTGKILGSKMQEAKGLRKQAEGKIEQKVGDIKEIAKNSTKKS